MVAVDILTVPVSTNGNRYLLVIQDYFTKWADAIPLPNQSASTITATLIKLFSQMRMPDIVHADQGHNFESAILKQSLDAFGISKSHTTAYHPEGDGMVERFNHSLLQLSHTYEVMLTLSLIVRSISQLHCMLTAWLYTLQQEYPHLISCLVENYIQQCFNLLRRIP